MFNYAERPGDRKEDSKPSEPNCADLTAEYRCQVFLALIGFGVFSAMILNLWPLARNYWSEITTTKIEMDAFDPSIFNTMSVCYNYQNNFEQVWRRGLENQSSFSVIDSFLASTSQGFLLYAMKPEHWESIRRPKFPSHGAMEEKMLRQDMQNELQSMASDLSGSNQSIRVLIKRKYTYRHIDKSFKFCLLLPLKTSRQHLSFKLYRKEKIVFVETIDFLSNSGPTLPVYLSTRFNRNLLEHTKRKNNIEVTTNIIAKITKYTFENLRRRPCITVNHEPQLADFANYRFGVSRCVQNCISAMIEKLFRCRFLDENIFHDPTAPICDSSRIYEEIIDMNHTVIWPPRKYRMAKFEELAELHSFQVHEEPKFRKLDFRKVVSWIATVYGSKANTCHERCKDHNYCVQWTLDTQASVKTAACNSVHALYETSHRHGQKNLGKTIKKERFALENSLLRSGSITYHHSPTYEDYQKIADKIRQLGRVTSCDVGLVCGTGLGPVAEKIEDKKIIPFDQIPGFPISTVLGHSGNFVVGKFDGKSVIGLQGRTSMYVRVMCLLGIKVLLVTNAVGSMHPDFKVGDFMLVKDHIFFPGLGGHSPLLGKNEDGFGPRFITLTDLYSKRLRHSAKLIATSKNIPLHEGIFGMSYGPQFETPAELRFMKNAGADVVGMSDVPESITACHCGIEVLSMSFISNKCVLDPDNKQPEPNHEDILEMGNVRAECVVALFQQLISNI